MAESAPKLDVDELGAGVIKEFSEVQKFKANSTKPEPGKVETQLVQQAATKHIEAKLTSLPMKAGSCSDKAPREALKELENLCNAFDKDDSQSGSSADEWEKRCKTLAAALEQAQQDGQKLQLELCPANRDLQARDRKLNSIAKDLYRIDHEIDVEIAQMSNETVDRTPSVLDAGNGSKAGLQNSNPKRRLPTSEQLEADIAKLESKQQSGRELSKDEAWELRTYKKLVKVKGTSTRYKYKREHPSGRKAGLSKPTNEQSLFDERI